MTPTLIIIGGGNMGGAIAARWHAAKIGNVHVVDTDEAKGAALKANGIMSHTSVADAPKGDVYLLAIKPQQFADYAASLKQTIATAQPLVLSIMAGIPLDALKQVAPRAVRTMPNLPALIGESMTAMYAPQLDAASRALTEQLFTAIGAVAWVSDEEMLHAVTAISGSGPAYIFAMMEALQKAAMAQGLPEPLARQLVTQTVRGAALLADASTDDAATLRVQVTSKGGTTEAALNAFSAGGLDKLVSDASAAAALRSKELAKA